MAFLLCVARTQAVLLTEFRFLSDSSISLSLDQLDGWSRARASTTSSYYLFDGFVYVFPMKYVEQNICFVILKQIFFPTVSHEAFTRNGFDSIFPPVCCSLLFAFLPFTVHSFCTWKFAIEIQLGTLIKNQRTVWAEQRYKKCCSCKHFHKISRIFGSQTIFDNWGQSSCWKCSTAKKIDFWINKY